MGTIIKPLPIRIESMFAAHAIASAEEQAENFGANAGAPFRLKGDRKASVIDEGALNFLEGMIEDNLEPLTMTPYRNSMEDIIFTAKWTMH